MAIIQLRSCFPVILFLLSMPVFAQQVGEHVSVSGVIGDDLYLAGGQVDMLADVQGDVVVAGGQLNIEGHVSADVTAAGGQIDLRGVVGDDARIAGGNIRVAATIKDDLVAAGGKLDVIKTAKVGGNAWLSGGEVYIDGHIQHALRVNGGKVVMSGEIDGDAEIWADEIVITDSALIKGKLHYSSPNPAKLADGARIEGEVTHTPVNIPVAPIIAGAFFVGLMIFFSLAVTGIVLYLIFPGVAEACSKTNQNKPWASLGYGLAVFAAVPVIIVILFSTGIGLLLALLLLAAYLLVLLTGYIVGAYFVASIGLRKMNRAEAGKTTQVIFLTLALLVLSLVNFVPVIGSLLNWYVLLAGMGALTIQMFEVYKKV